MATILVVDDEPSVLRLAVTVLEKAGHRVLKASNGLEALLMYESYAARLELVVTDVVMPEMDGLQLAARIRATHPGARILLMSAGAPAGFGRVPEGYPLVIKPFLPEKLLEAVEDLCGGSGGPPDS